MPKRTKKRFWYRISTSKFTAEFMDEAGIVRKGSSILEWAMGHSTQEILEWVQRKQGTVEKLDAK